MRSIKVYTSSSSISTNINGDDKMIAGCYLGTFIDVGVDEKEKREEVHTVSFLGEGDTYSIFAANKAKDNSEYQFTLIARYSNLDECEAFISNHLHAKTSNSLIMGYVIKTH
ncbi:MAG: Unknown protein [uncultured Sulfurovum sp.]|uniref:Uncharacterized protein n=1 Tax=uncultured Sulfurovum sp. TaxID=269237 RepID=A0A6S6SZ11_9BACT|nr:MAG: Unknown protein [uncultured Sulfurovum sp.]